MIAANVVHAQDAQLQNQVKQAELSDLIAAKAFIQELKGKSTRQLKEIVLKTPNTPELEEGERLLLVMSIKILQGRMPKASYNTFLLEVVEEAARIPKGPTTGRTRSQEPQPAVLPQVPYDVLIYQDPGFSRNKDAD